LTVKEVRVVALLSVVADAVGLIWLAKMMSQRFLVNALWETNATSKLTDAAYLPKLDVIYQKSRRKLYSTGFFYFLV
jgi:hypothetical protein